MESNTYGSAILEDTQFRAHRETMRMSMGEDASLRSAALELQIKAERYEFGYQQEWCGVPVIRLPDDIVILQEIIWHLRPAFIIETGVARGGSLVLSASLMSISGCSPRVLGLDIQILGHTRRSLRESPFGDAITTWEGDSASASAAQVVEKFILDTQEEGPGLLVLDSDHSHNHVLGELRELAQLLPLGSLVLVADTLIEEMPTGHYPDRPWDKGNNPLTATTEFLDENRAFVRSTRWSRRGLITEFRDGILERVSD